MPVMEKRVKDGPDNSGSIVSNGSIGRRLLNVEEAAQYLGLSVDTPPQVGPVTGDSSRQGRSCVAVRSGGTKPLYRRTHNRNH